MEKQLNQTDFDNKVGKSEHKDIFKYPEKSINVVMPVFMVVAIGRTFYRIEYSESVHMPQEVNRKHNEPDDGSDSGS